VALTKEQRKINTDARNVPRNETGNIKRSSEIGNVKKNIVAKTVEIKEMGDKMNKDLIEALKKNERPFGLMSQEMQAKAEGIGFCGNFRRFLGPTNWSGVISNPAHGHSYISTYRLRSDYQEQPEIVERKVDTNEFGFLCVNYDGCELMLTEALDHPNAVGFKYEKRPDKIVAVTRQYWDNVLEGWCIDPTVESINSGQVEVLTPTHALFRGNNG
jgi:hypothetical protein